MADYVTLANLALSKIGAADTIVDPDQDSHAARSIAAVWNEVRRRCIRGGKVAPKWNFAMSFHVTPARAVADDTPVPHGWVAAFPKPDGAVRLAQILYPDCSAAGSWLYAGGEVLTLETGPLKAWWLADIVNPDLWDDLFVDTFAARLAYQICDTISGDRGRKNDCLVEYEANLLAAAKVDAGENPPIVPEESDWIMARFGGTSGWTRSDWRR